MKIVADTVTDLRISDRHAAISVVAGLVALLLAVVAIARVVSGSGFGGWAAPLLGALICGSGAVAFSGRRSFHFDGRRRQLVWSRKSLFRSAGGVVPFDDIRCAFVDYRDGSGPKSPADFYRVALASAAGTLPLSDAYSGGRIADDRCQVVRSRINAMLGRAFESESDNDILQLVQSDQKLSACKLAQYRKGFGVFGMNQAVAYIDALIGSRVSRS